MKIICNKPELVSAISNVQHAVSSKSSIPALEGILLTAQNGILTICGYDLEIGMTTKIPSMIEQNGSIVLNARLFSDIVRRLPEEQVFISSDEKNMTTITCGQSEFSIIGIPAAEYPEMPIVTDSESVMLNHSILKSMIRQTIYATAVEDAKSPIYTGTLFEIDENEIRLISVDGIRLAIRKELLEEKVSSSMKFVVPGKTLMEVMKLLKDDDSKVSMKVGKRHIIFEIGDYIVLSRLLEGDFLNYNAVIPKTNTTLITVQTRTFTESVERVSLLINDRRKIPVRCLFENNEIKLSCETEIGRANDQFRAEIEGENVEMGFNNKYLLDALKNAEDDEIKIELNGPFSPMKIVPKEGESFIYLVLPVRL